MSDKSSDKVAVKIENPPQSPKSSFDSVGLVPNTVDNGFDLAKSAKTPEPEHMSNGLDTI